MTRAYTQKIIGLLCLILMPCFAPSAKAQPMTLQQLETHLKQANIYESQNKLEQALQMYQEAYANFPTRSDVLIRMTLLLSRMGKHAETATLLRQYLKKYPNDLISRLRLGDALISQGKPDSAYAEWQVIIANEATPNTYAMVADNYRKHNLDARAANIYHQARNTLNNPTLFAQELAELAERQAQYDIAVREYLNLLTQRPQYRPLVEARLRDFAQAGEQHDQILTTLSNEVTTHPDDRTRLGLLIEYALPAGADDKALSLLLNTKGLPDNAWTYLFRLAQHALETGRFLTAQKAYQSLFTTIDRPDVQARALLGLAHTSDALQQPNQAKTYHQTLIDRYPQRPESDEAYYYLALLQRNSDNTPDMAQATLNTLIQSNRRSPWRYRAFFELAEGYLQADQFDKAEQAWQHILSERPTGPEASQARFQLAELHFLTGHTDTAQTQLQTMLATDPSSDAVNDAIALSSLIQEAQQYEPELLTTYANILLQKRQRKTEAALKAAQTFTLTYAESFLEDRILFLQAELHEALTQYPQALQTYRTIITTMSWSPFCPNAQMAIARIYDTKLSQFFDAKKAYETVLIDYPESLEADLAREQLRIIQQKIKDIESKKEAG